MELRNPSVSIIRAEVEFISDRVGTVASINDVFLPK